MGCVVSQQRNNSLHSVLEYSINPSKTTTNIINNSLTDHQINPQLLQSIEELDDGYIQHGGGNLNQQLFKISPQQLKELLHRSIGCLRFLTSKKQPKTGSGVIISKNMVLTCAHNVFDKVQQTQNQQIKFYFEDQGKGKNYYKIIDYRYPQQYKICQSKDNSLYDYALLKLQKDVQYDNFMKMSVACKTCFLNKNTEIELKIFGYPSNYLQNYKDLDKHGNQFILSQYGLARKNRIIKFDDKLWKIFYQIETKPGQSGCPICIDQSIVAIHIGNLKRQKDINIGRIIDIDLFTNIRKWCNFIKGHPIQLKQEGICAHIQPQVKEYFKKRQENKNKKRVPIEQKQKDLTYFDLSKKLQVSHLDLSSNKLSKVDISKNINLIHLSLRDNYLTTIDVSKNTNLTRLFLWNNQLQQIDVRANINLRKLIIWNNKLSTIDVRMNVNLTQLNLSRNKIRQLDVSNNISLTLLYLHNNDLSAINIMKNMNLVQLDLGNNNIQEINVYNNIYLTHLVLAENKMSLIDLKMNINLLQLELKENLIGEIDLTKNINLTYISLSYNVLKLVSLTFSQKLQYTDFSHQKSAEFRIQLLLNFRLIDRQDQYKRLSQFEKCSQLKKRWMKQYQNKINNKQQCKYTFKVIKQE